MEFIGMIVKAFAWKGEEEKIILVAARMAKVVCVMMDEG